MQQQQQQQQQQLSCTFCPITNAASTTQLPDRRYIIIICALVFILLFCICFSIDNAAEGDYIVRQYVHAKCFYPCERRRYPVFRSDGARLSSCVRTLNNYPRRLIIIFSFFCYFFFIFFSSSFFARHGTMENARANRRRAPIAGRGLLAPPKENLVWERYDRDTYLRAYRSDSSSSSS